MQKKLNAKTYEPIRLVTDTDYKTTKIKWLYNEDGTNLKLKY